MNYYLESTVLLSSEALPVLSGAMKLKSFDTSLRIFFALCITTFVVEVLALIAASMDQGHNMLVYNIAAIIIQVMHCLYFNYSIDYFERNAIGLWLSLASLMAWLIAIRIGGSIEDMDTFFLYFQYIVIVTMAIVSMNTSHKDESVYTHAKSVHFWISLLMILSCCLFFVQWGLYKWLVNNRPSVSVIVNDYLTVSSCLLNVAFATVLLCFKDRNYGSR